MPTHGLAYYCGVQRENPKKKKSSGGIALRKLCLEIVVSVLVGRAFYKSTKIAIINSLHEYNTTVQS